MAEGLSASALALAVHDGPGDFYRFSAQAMAEVLLAGTQVQWLDEVMDPPRFIGFGRKPPG
jgi:hypothetical protein